MIVTTITSGLGNQLFQYAAGFGLASKRNAQLVMDTRFYQQNQMRPFELGRFNLSGRLIRPWDALRLRVSAPPPKFKLSARSLIQRAIRAAPIPRLRFFNDPQLGFDPTLLQQPDDTVLNGYWQNELYFAHCGEALRREFRFNTSPDPANAQMLEKISAGVAVAVHVRRTDYLNAAEVVGPCGLDYYRRALSHVAEKVPAANYFVFSDDPDWSREHLQIPGPVTFVTHNTGVNDPEDLRLMSACRHFVVANSTFSWWGAWLCEGADKIVIAPRRWFKADHGNEQDIVPARWLRL